MSYRSVLRSLVGILDHGKFPRALVLVLIALTGLTCTDDTALGPRSAQSPALRGPASARTGRAEGLGPRTLAGNLPGPTLSASRTSGPMLAVSSNAFETSPLF